MSELQVAPTGFSVLIQQDKVEATSEGGIFLGDVTREQRACESGTVLAIGPIAFRGIAGCDPKEYSPSNPRSEMEPHQIYGINVGDRVDFTRYAGDTSAFVDDKLVVYCQDSSIKGRALKGAEQ